MDSDMAQSSNRANIDKQRLQDTLLGLAATC